MNLVRTGIIDEQKNTVLDCYTNPGGRESGHEVSFLLCIAACSPESMYQFIPFIHRWEKTGRSFFKIVELLVSFIFFFILYFFQVSTIMLFIFRKTTK